MLHFAPRYGRISPCLDRPSERPLPRAANDDGAGQALAKANGTTQDSDAVLTAALRLFATHGLSAASHACHAAAEAEAKGDADGIQWWLSVCRTLDRRKAREFQAEVRLRRVTARG
jgi:hypothetical protein